MKLFLKKSTTFICLIFTCLQIQADDDFVVVSSTDMTDSLNLYAVAEIFKNSETLELFEQRINDPETGINNLDIDGNGEVDFIRVVDEVNELTHVIILQVDLGENQFQDVANIEVEKDAIKNNYNIQIRGNEYLYGANYFIAPTQVYVNAWPVLTWIYKPNYHPYRSAYFYNHYPVWWRVFQPVQNRIYRSRTVKFNQNKTFVRTKKTRVLTVSKVKYKPHRTTSVKKRKVETKKVKVKNASTKKVKTKKVKKQKNKN